MKKNKVIDLTLPCFRTRHNTTVIKSVVLVNDLHIDQWNNPYIDGELIFNKCAKTVQQEKKSFPTNKDRTTGYPLGKQ